MGNGLNERWWECNVGQVLEPTLRAAPEREALVCGRRRLSYAELEEEIRRATATLEALGVRAGDRVAVSLPNSVEIVAAFHGVARLGAMFVGLNRQLAAPEKEWILGNAGVSLVLADAAGCAQLRAGAPAERRIVEVDAHAGEGEWHELLAAHDGAPEIKRDVAPTDPVAIAYTSGTTGFPKGVVHSHRNVLVPPAVQILDRGYDHTFRRADWLPSTIINVVAASTLMACQAGGTQITIDSTHSSDIVEAIRNGRPTVFQGVPALLYTMIHDPSVTPEDFDGVEEVLTGGAPTAEPLRRAFFEKFGLAIVDTYGLTEGPFTLSLDGRGGTDHVDGASGRPMPHVDVFAVDEDDQRLPADEVGEICVKPRTDGPFANTYTLMLGYWDNPEATAKVLRNGMLHTGDVGRVSASGHLFITDRKNSLILRGGSNVYPAEVERAMVAIDGVVDCCVVGVPDERLGERVGAVVQLEAGTSLDADGIRRRLAEVLAPYKVPERLLFVDSFPRNSMNKIVRNEVKHMFAGER